MKLDNPEVPATVPCLFPHPGLTQKSIPSVQRKCANELISSFPQR